MRISDWSSDVCSSDLILLRRSRRAAPDMVAMVIEDFAARPARPGVAHRPEIVAGRDTDDTAFGQPRNLAPQIECLVVGVIDSRGQLFGRDRKRTRLNYSH